MGKPRGREPTERELIAAAWGLAQLDEHRLTVELAPAPRPQHRSHKIRVAVAHNPEWFQSWRQAHPGSTHHRFYAVRALRRVLSGSVLPSPYSIAEELLELLIAELDEREARGDYS